MPSDARSPFVFVVGCPRSGTTLLQRILDHHPRLAVANDTHFVARCVQKHARDALDGLTAGAPLPLTPELEAGVRGYHRFSRLDVDAADVDTAFARSETYQELVSRLYAAFAQRQGKELGGEKTPDFVRQIPLLHGMFPAAKFVHIHRDGRDVALSTLEWAHEKKGPGRLELWKDEPVGVCALWWRRQVRSGLAGGACLAPGRYIAVRYENLVADPAVEVRRIVRFLELDWAPETLDYHVGRERPAAGLSAKSAWLRPTRGLRNWRTTMGERDRALFEALAGDLLTELGYERSIAMVGPEVGDAAERCRRWWDERGPGVHRVKIMDTPPAPAIDGTDTKHYPNST